MPLQVRAFPKYLPQILSSYVGRLGERVLTNDRRIVPLRANLEYFDALPIQAVANIEFWTYVRRRSALGQESRHGIFDALNVKIVECHGLYLVKQGELRHCTQQQLSGIVLVRELPATTCRCLLRLNWSRRAEPNGRFSASNLKVGISRTGQKRKFSSAQQRSSERPLNSETRLTGNPCFTAGVVSGLPKATWPFPVANQPFHFQGQLVSISTS